MSKRDFTAAVVDNILRFTLTSGTIAAAVVVPNLLIALDKPLDRYFKHLDSKARERELRRVITYMKSRKLLSTSYSHGLQITKKGRQRLNKADFNNLRIKAPKKWDGNWRLVFFDIPESYKLERDAFSGKLKRLGFISLQRSVWIYPFHCRKIIEAAANYYKIDSYITYVETTYIDNQDALIKKFKSLHI